MRVGLIQYLTALCVLNSKCLCKWEPAGNPTHAGYSCEKEEIRDRLVLTSGFVVGMISRRAPEKLKSIHAHYMIIIQKTTEPQCLFTTRSSGLS